MKKTLLFSLLFVLGCGESDLKRSGPINNNANNNQTCIGDAPAADRQDGVCAGARKVCAQADDAWNWVEPDYASIEGYEAEETSCDGRDNDCDGTTDEGMLAIFYRDADEDGFGNPTQTAEACSAPTGYVSDNTDCDDTSEERFPGNIEVCDGLDNNCNESVDEGLLSVFYRDADSDGYGNPADFVTACAAPGGYVANSDDCDDTSAYRFPGNLEVCDGLDNDCNGFVDDNAQLTFYRDADGDGHGNTADSILACTPPAGYVITDDDCDDTSAYRFPGNPEVCDEIDNDCNGFVDDNAQTTYYRDADGDGYGNPADSLQACATPAGYVADNTDCNDSSASVRPNASETCNGIDDNCNGGIDEGVQTRFYRDVDGDGVGIASDSAWACTLPPGYAWIAGDCNDADPRVYPGKLEECDGMDNDCDGTIDEGC